MSAEQPANTLTRASRPLTRPRNTSRWHIITWPTPPPTTLQHFMLAACTGRCLQWLPVEEEVWEKAISDLDEHWFRAQSGHTGYWKSDAQTDLIPRSNYSFTALVEAIPDYDWLITTRISLSRIKWLHTYLVNLCLLIDGHLCTVLQSIECKHFTACQRALIAISVFIYHN